MDLIERTFTGQTVALATGATVKEIANWADRGLIIGQREALGKGHKRAFSWFNIMEIGGAAALMSIGVNSPADAFAASQHFAHGSDGAIGTWDGDDAVQGADDEPGRWAGLPFHYAHGDTFLCVAGNKAHVALSSDGTLNLSEIKLALHKPHGFIVLNVSDLFKQITFRMAMDYREVLDEIYGK